jgi:hypothetical protein
LGPIPQPLAEAGIVYCVLELDSFWRSFARSLFLSTAFRAKDGSGGRVTLSVPTPGTVDDALTHAIHRIRPTVKKKAASWSWLDEPNWSRSSNLLDSLDEIGASNRPTVVAGLSIPTRVFDDLTVLRNFFAHRNEDTAGRVPSVARSYSIAPTMRPSDVLRSRASGASGLRPQVLLLDWIDDMVNAVSLAI